LVAAAIACQTRRQCEPDHGHDRMVLAVRPHDRRTGPAGLRGVTAIRARCRSPAIQY
jgi:hypothetical protein